MILILMICRAIRAIHVYDITNIARCRPNNGADQRNVTQAYTSTCNNIDLKDIVLLGFTLRTYGCDLITISHHVSVSENRIQVSSAGSDGGRTNTGVDFTEYSHPCCITFHCRHRSCLVHGCLASASQNRYIQSVQRTKRVRMKFCAHFNETYKTVSRFQIHIILRARLLNIHGTLGILAFVQIAALHLLFPCHRIVFKKPTLLQKLHYSNEMRNYNFTSY